MKHNVGDLVSIRGVPVVISHIIDQPKDPLYSVLSYEIFGGQKRTFAGTHDDYAPLPVNVLRFINLLMHTEQNRLTVSEIDHQIELLWGKR